MTAFQKKQMRLSDPGCLKTPPEPSVLMRWTRRLPSGDTDGRQPDVWRFIMEIDILGIDLAKQVFVRPASRLSFCLTGECMA
jgi:hypothetical protein